jgi:hypothetical protein
MRLCLALLFAAGITSARYQAKVTEISSRGYLRLESLSTPIGDEEHCWVSVKGCKSLPPVGKVSEFLASIEPYNRDDGSADFALAHIRAAEVH